MIDTKENLKLVTKRGIPLMIVDPVIKSIFSDNPNVLAKFISDITDYNYYELKDNITILNNELNIKTKKERAKRSDFLVKIDNNKYTNIEVNNNSEESALIKNLSYVFHIYSTVTKKGNKYDKELEVIQINLDYHSFDMEDYLEKFYLTNAKDKILTKSIIIYFLDIEKCYEIWYDTSKLDKLNNLVKWGAFLYSGKYKEMESILSELVSEKEVRKIMSSLENIKLEDIDWSEEERREWDEWLKNSKLDRIKEEIKLEARQEGLEEGRVEGLAEGRVEGLIK